MNDRTTAKIHIYKVDKESGKAVAQGDASLEGAVYGLYARNDIVHPDGATGVVDISYGGATTAAAEAQGLDEAGKTVSFDELQPGDLIFYSFTSNGRYKNISHVAVYVGNGKVVEALNESLGVVYRDVASTGKIVVIGRP